MFPTGQYHSSNTIQQDGVCRRNYELFVGTLVNAPILVLDYIFV